MILDEAVNLWAHSRESLGPLYEARARGDEGQELTAWAQAAELYQPLHRAGDRVLDAGCGSGGFYWSLAGRGLEVDYHGLDYTAWCLELARRHLPVAAGNLTLAALEEIKTQYEVVFCLNVLFGLPDYRPGLESLLNASRQALILRAPLGKETQIRYETDDYVDPSGRDLKSYFNIWSFEEVKEFIISRGFQVHSPVDRRTADQGEISAGKFFPWRFLVARRRQ